MHYILLLIFCYIDFFNIYRYSIDLICLLGKANLL